MSDPDLYFFEHEADWLSARAPLITSSRGPSVLGLGFHSAYGLNLELRGRAPVSTLEDNDILEFGRESEDGMLRMLAKRIPGLEIRKPAPYILARSAARPWLGASPDALALHPEMDGLGVVELKTVRPELRDLWISREDGSTLVPPYPAVQASHHALALDGASWGVVACMVLGVKFVFKITRTDFAWCDRVYLPRLQEFHEAVAADRDWPADASPATAKVLRARFPKEVAGKTITLPDEAVDLVEQFEEASAQAREWAKTKDEAKAQLLALMGDAEVGLLDGERFVRCVERPRRGYTVADTTTRSLAVKRF